MIKTDNQILLAARLAADAHKGQTRNWGRSADPYILHPMRVAGRVAIHPRADANMVAAAFLHDVVEDCGLKAVDLLDKGVNKEVVGMMLEVTNPKMPGVARAERKETAREMLAKASWEARMIKLADRIDNVREIIYDSQTPKDFAKLYLNESKLLLDALKGTDNELEAELVMLIARGNLK